jgi:hypothetical protein
MYITPVAGTPPMLTPVSPLKFEPLIVTVKPGPVPVGVKVLMTGGGTKPNPGRLTVPPVVVTETLPLTALGLTIAVMRVGLTTM